MGNFGSGEYTPQTFSGTIHRAHWIVGGHVYHVFVAKAFFSTFAAVFRFCGLIPAGGWSIISASMRRARAENSCNAGVSCETTLVVELNLVANAHATSQSARPDPAESESDLSCHPSA